jgi:fumarate reductase subunit C/fumarate reductase subunit D
MSAPTTYRQPVSRLWWLKKRTYLLFVLRELSSVFVAWFAVFLMIMVYAIGRGEASYQNFVNWAASPVVIVINIVALAFLVLHTATWFVLTPQAMVVRAPGRGRQVPAMKEVRVAGRTVPAATVIRVGKRRIEPLLWLLFSGGGVVSAVFLPILVILFGLAIPLGLLQPNYNHLYAVVSHWLTRLVLLGLFVLMLFHAAHRFRFTLQDGLQLRRLEAPIAVLCYGGALVGSLAALLIVLTI